MRAIIQFDIINKNPDDLMRALETREWTPVDFPDEDLEPKKEELIGTIAEEDRRRARETYRSLIYDEYTRT